MGPPHKVYVPPHPSPPITALSPRTCPPPIWGGTSPPPYHQGLGKTLVSVLSPICVLLFITTLSFPKLLFTLKFFSTMGFLLNCAKSNSFFFSGLKQTPLTVFSEVCTWQSKNLVFPEFFTGETAWM